MKHPLNSSLVALIAGLLAASSATADTPKAPDWAQPGSATHQQVPPPVDFHRKTTTDQTPIGIFQGQSDVGSALVPGSAKYDAKTKRYTIDSAGYNIWYTRDEFRYLWKKLSGDVSLATDIAFPNADGYFDRKVVLVFRQDLDDDSKEIMTALHGGGLVHLAYRPEKNAEIKEAYRIAAPEKADAASGQHKIVRLGIEKKGNSFTLWVAGPGEAMHQVGPAATLDLKEPFYVGIGFTSHLPVTSDTAVVSNVVLENKAGRVK